jgi:hypothetical protein
MQPVLSIIAEPALLFNGLGSSGGVPFGAVCTCASNRSWPVVYFFQPARRIEDLIILAVSRLSPPPATKNNKNLKKLLFAVG